MMTNAHATAAAAQKPRALYLADFMTGVLAALAQRGVTVLSARQNRLDQAFERLFPHIEDEAQRNNLRLRFTIRTHPLHGDSDDLQHALTSAAKRDLVSIDNPEFQDVRLKLSPQGASKYLSGLPGNPEMYARLASKLWEIYAAK